MNRILFCIFASLGIVQIDAMQARIAHFGLKKLFSSTTATVAHIGLSSWPIVNGATGVVVASSETIRKFAIDNNPNLKPAKKETSQWVQETLGDKSVINTVVIDSTLADENAYNFVDYLSLSSAIEGPASDKVKSSVKPFLPHENTHGADRHILKEGLINIAMPFCHLIGAKIFPSYARIIMKNGLTKIGSGLVNTGIYTVIGRGVRRHCEREADLAITDLDGAIRTFKNSNPSGLPQKTGWFDDHDSEQQRIEAFQKRKLASQQNHTKKSHLS
jgi:hypothetical protein